MHSTKCSNLQGLRERLKHIKFRDLLTTGREVSVFEFLYINFSVST